MKNNNKITLGAAILGVIITTAIVASGTYAFGGKMGQMGEKFNRGDDFRTAVEANDYSMLGENPNITEEDFAKMVEIHNAMQSGDQEKAQELRSELDMPGKGQGWKNGIGQKEKRGGFNQENREAINEALDNNDYNAWVAAVGEDCPMLELINQENFSRLVEAHNHMSQAHEIMKELGFEGGEFGHFGSMRMGKK